MTQVLGVPPSELRIELLTTATPKQVVLPQEQYFEFRAFEESLAKFFRRALPPITELKSLYWAVCHVVHGDLCYSENETYGDLRFEIVGLSEGYTIPWKPDDFGVKLASSDQMEEWDAFRSLLASVDRSVSWKDPAYTQVSKDDWEQILEDLYMISALRALHQLGSSQSGLLFYSGLAGDTAEEWMNLLSDFNHYDRSK